MKPLRAVTISADDMEFVYHAVLKYGSDLEQHLSWLKTKDGKPLPGADIAIAEVHKEVVRYQALALDLYGKCYSAGVAPAAPMSIRDKLPMGWNVAVELAKKAPLSKFEQRLSNAVILKVDAMLTAGVKASGLPAWVDGLRDFMERNGRTPDDIGNVLVAAGFAVRGDGVKEGGK
jgi:hypothetical protein